MGLSEQQAKCLRTIFEHFDQTGSWPTYRRVYRTMARDGLTTDLRAFLTSLPTEVAWQGYIPDDQELVLTVPRLQICAGSQAIIAAFVSLVRFSAKRYLASEEDDVVISNGLVEAELGINHTLAMRAARLFQVEAVPWRSISIGEDGTWSLTLGDEIHFYRSINSIDDFRAVQDQRAQSLGRWAITPTPPPTSSSPEQVERKADTVFVAYGRDEDARRAVFDLLRSAGLRPLEWEQAVRMAGKGSPFVGEVLDVALAQAQAIIILMTGDETASLLPRLLDKEERAGDTEAQPRPNVILEAGMALGRYPERTIIVEMGHVRVISDLLGRHVIRLDNSVSKRKALLLRLETTGCNVDFTGDDWMSTGHL
jgi:predicted nucleotide-binding protein